MRVVSLYIHVPFCTRRCPYCSFYHVARDAAVESDFVDALAEEVAHACDRLGDVRFGTVFVGGGTPSALGPSLLARVFETITPYTDAEVTTEVTCELNPEDVDGEVLAVLREGGANRVSLGVQSMNADAQRTLKRCTPDVNFRSIERTMGAFDNVNFDVLLGVPGGGTERTVESMRRLARLEPKHFSVYCLEPGGDMEDEVSEFFDAVDPARAAEEYLAICDLLAGLGYRHYEVSNFAHRGFESDHNRVYWGGGEYLGVGPGAHSFIGGRRFHNTPSLERYLSLRGARCIAERVHDDTDENGADMERVMLALRTDDGLPLEWVRCGSGEVEALSRAGLARADNDRLVLTDRGFLLMNDIVLRVIRNQPC